MVRAAEVRDMSGLEVCAEADVGGSTVRVGVVTGVSDVVTRVKVRGAEVLE